MTVLLYCGIFTNFLKNEIVGKIYFSPNRHKLAPIIAKFIFLLLILGFDNAAVLAQTSNTLYSLSDAYVRNGTYASTNYGNDTSLIVKGSTSSGYARLSYLKFSLSGLSNISSAKLRLYGRNIDNTSTISISAYGLDNDSWTESGITYNNAPTTTSTALSSTGVSNQAKYYEFDVTNYVIAQSGADGVVSFLIKDAANQNKNIVFNSRQNSKNPPQLLVSVSNSTQTPSNALLFVENLDKFPANDYFVASRIQIPWSRDKVNYNANHDSLTVRIHNNGINTLVIKDLVLSSTSRWKIEKLKGVSYVPGSGLPLSISSGTYADVTVRFIAVDQATRVKVLHDTLRISSNDDKFPLKNIYLNGVWQKQGEGSNEPYQQEVLNAFGYKTSTGFGHTDPDLGDSTKLKGSEIKPSYFLRADTSRPVSVRQINAYHGCCTSTEKISWFLRGSSGTLNTIFTHAAKDGQSVLPRKNSSTSPAQGSFSTSGIFGFEVGYSANSDPSKNYQGKLGVRVYKALDANGNIIPNSYILSNDYLGTSSTNYDYNDNAYFVSNVKPWKGTVYYSQLKASPSALDFGEKVLLTNNSLQLNLSSLGHTYSDGSADPAIKISSVTITGENKSEFTASVPALTTLNPQQSTTLTVNFKPATQGLKIADLLIYYNNSLSPLRVPLYGIAKSSGTTVTANYRVNSGSSNSITLNGKTWSADNQYSFDNLEPYSNSNLKQIACTDEDALYLKEQSSNGDKKPFRYEFPVTNGDYSVRLHFAEIYWGAPGSGLSGGAGSRVMNITIENQLRLANFDVTQEVGGATAIVKNFPVHVSDGKLNINFSANVNRPMVCAVEVYSFHSSSARPVVNDDSLIVNNSIEKVRAFPNPVQGKLRVIFPNKYEGNAYLQIIDAIGKTYPIGNYKIASGGSNIEVNISDLSLKPGFYYLQVISETKPTEVVKLVVQ